MAMTPVPYGRGAGSFIAGEANFWRSRQHEILIQGQTLVAGTVLGRITASNKVTQLAPGANDGSQNVAGVLFDAMDSTPQDERVVMLARAFEADGQMLTWPASLTPAQKTAALAQLAAVGVVVR